jgi:hypothetical protein
VRRFTTKVAEMLVKFKEADVKVWLINRDGPVRAYGTVAE